MAARRLTYFIKAAEWVQHAATEPRLQQLGVSYGQLALLMSIADDPGITAAELARRSGITPQSIGETVAALVRKSLVGREGDEANARRMRLSVLPAGERLLGAAQTILDEIEAQLTQPLDPEKVEIAKELLAQLISGGARRD